jgi:hypothetical protein
MPDPAEEQLEGVTRPGGIGASSSESGEAASSGDGEARRGQSPCHRQTRRVRALKVALKADLVAAAVSASDLSLMLTGASMGLRSLL